MRTISPIFKGLRIQTKYGTAEFCGTGPELTEVLIAAQGSLLYRNHEWGNIEFLSAGATTAGRMTVQDWPFNLAAPLPF